MNVGNHALLVAGALNPDLIAAGEFAFLAAWKAVKQLAVRNFDDAVAAVCRDNEAAIRYSFGIVFRHSVSLPG